MKKVILQVPIYVKLDAKWICQKIKVEKSNNKEIVCMLVWKSQWDRIYKEVDGLRFTGASFWTSLTTEKIMASWVAIHNPKIYDYEARRAKAFSLVSTKWTGADAQCTESRGVLQSLCRKWAKVFTDVLSRFCLCIKETRNKTWQRRRKVLDEWV